MFKPLRTQVTEFKYILFQRVIDGNIPWVPETFLARFPVSVKSL